MLVAPGETRGIKTTNVFEPRRGSTLISRITTVQVCPSLPQGKLARDDDSSNTAGKQKIKTNHEQV